VVMHRAEFWQLWVMLHRARMALRECLEMNWFDKPAGGRV